MFSFIAWLMPGIEKEDTIVHLANGVMDEPGLPSMTAKLGVGTHRNLYNHSILSWFRVHVTRAGRHLQLDPIGPVW